jgi:hypothetical protein
VVSRVPPRKRSTQVGEQRFAHYGDNDPLGQLSDRHPLDGDNMIAYVIQGTLGVMLSPSEHDVERRVQKLRRPIEALTHIRKVADVHMLSRLLEDLAQDGLLEQLAGLLPAAGKIPQRLRVVGVPRGDEQDAPVTNREPRRKMDHAHRLDSFAGETLVCCVLSLSGANTA